MHLLMTCFNNFLYKLLLDTQPEFTWFIKYNDKLRGYAE